MKLNKYDNLVVATNALLKRGFKSDFKLTKNGMKDLKTKKLYQPEDMAIVEYHRFEGMTNPSDMSIIFAVVCNDQNKGTVISSYGTYADMQLVKFMDKVKIQKRAYSTS
ncbi:MAG: phosphoribosylpyrophosphate synthetase [Bacteroidota bacterium]